MNHSRAGFAVIRIGEGNESVGHGNSYVTVPGMLWDRERAVELAKRLAEQEVQQLNENAGDEAFYLSQPQDGQFDVFEANSKNSNGLWASLRVAELPTAEETGLAHAGTGRQQVKSQTGEGV